MKKTALFLLALNLLSMASVKADLFSIKDYNRIARIGAFATSLEAKVNSDLYNIYYEGEAPTAKKMLISEKLPKGQVPSYLNYKIPNGRYTAEPVYTDKTSLKSEEIACFQSQFEEIENIDLNQFNTQISNVKFNFLINGETIAKASKSHYTLEILFSLDEKGQCTTVSKEQILKSLKK